MNTNLLYLIVVAIGGTSWIFIKFQLGEVPLELSVAYRFGLAAVLLAAWARYKEVKLLFSPRTHVFLALGGLFLFSANYLCIYKSAEFIASGAIAVLYSTIVVMNILNKAVLQRVGPEPRMMAGALLGLAGIVVVFWPDLVRLDLATAASTGMLIALLGTYLSSLGHIAASRNFSQGVPVLSGTAYGMGYGAIFMLLFFLAKGGQITFDPSFRYTASLMYLVVVTSAIGLGSYLELIRRIGPERASYANVLFPVAALGVSTLFEGLQWTLNGGVGILLILIGNFLVLAKQLPFRPRSVKPA
jgi:drug/metabolite transporter (DMT)-like permease